jgi:tetratricopeptide (TPR) repeat protein
MSDLGLPNWQQYREALPDKPLDNPQLPATPTIDPKLAAIQHAAGLALLDQKQLDQGIAYLQAAVESDPTNLRYGNDYRITLRDHQRYDDEEQFYDALYKKNDDVTVGIGLALSYVDQMRSCPKPPDGLVCQAQYSSRSITLLDSLLTAHPYNVIARYARGLNNLYWPTLMGHLPTAQTDLEYAVALTSLMETSSPAFIDDAYTALGDVFAKDKHVDEAINIWRNGLLATPGSSLLQSRLDLSRDKIVDEMNGPIRGLGVYVDTGITLFWT